jgi:SAM-dependent methyltransferase
MTLPPDWRALNQANWDERVPIHVRAKEAYDLPALRAGTDRLDPIAAKVLGPAGGKRVLHPQCHFGMDSLLIARQGASVTGLDFSPPAIATARSLAAELGLADRARFVEANVYDALTAIPEPGGFDRVFVSWGALCWLPDMVAWARVVAAFLAPGGYLALADRTRLSTSSTAPTRQRMGCQAGMCRIWAGPRRWKTSRATTRTQRPGCATAGPGNGCIPSATF